MYPIFIHLGVCDVSTSMLVINVTCTYANNMASGFLVVVKSSVLAREGTIYAERVEKTSNSATIEVEENGEYFVFIIPTLQDTGIVDSMVEYMENVMVESTGMSSGTQISEANIIHSLCYN